MAEIVFKKNAESWNRQRLIACDPGFESKRNIYAFFNLYSSDCVFVI